MTDPELQARRGSDGEKKGRKKRYNFAPNIERNNILYHEWSSDRTIDEAVFRTDIARSTVGYYYKKFDRYAREGRPIPYGLSFEAFQTQQENSKDKERNKKMRVSFDNVSSIQDLSVAKQVRILELQGKIAEAQQLLMYYERKKKFEEERLKRLEEISSPERDSLLNLELINRTDSLNFFEFQQYPPAATYSFFPQVERPSPQSKTNPPSEKAGPPFPSNPLTPYLENFTDDEIKQFHKNIEEAETVFKRRSESIRSEIKSRGLTSGKNKSCIREQWIAGQIRDLEARGKIEEAKRLLEYYNWPQQRKPNPSGEKPGLNVPPNPGTLNLGNLTDEQMKNLSKKLEETDASLKKRSRTLRNEMAKRELGAQHESKSPIHKKGKTDSDNQLGMSRENADGSEP